MVAANVSHARSGFAAFSGFDRVLRLESEEKTWKSLARAYS